MEEEFARLQGQLSSGSDESEKARSSSIGIYMEVKESPTTLSNMRRISTPPAYKPAPSLHRRKAQGERVLTKIDYSCVSKEIHLKHLRSQEVRPPER